jgi:PAS domain S-box-containing protein
MRLVTPLERPPAGSGPADGRRVAPPISDPEALRFLADATDLLAGSIDYEATLGSIARLAIPRLADWCIVDELLDDGSLSRVAVAAALPEKQALLEELRRRYAPTWDSPQPAARALRSRQTVVFDTFDDDALRRTTRDEDHFELLRKLGPRTAVAVPLFTKGEPIGAITFALAESGRLYGPDDIALAEQVARRAGIALDRARLLRREREARLRAEAAQEQMAFLAQTTELFAESLDYEGTLERVARLAVPRLADWCIVYVVEEDGEIRRLAVAHEDAEERRAAEEHLRDLPLDPEAPVGVPHVLRTGEPELVREPTLELLAGDVEDPKRFVATLGDVRPPSSWMCVPLVARGRTLGALAFIASTPGRHFDGEDLALGAEVARRAAVAIDQARIHRGEQLARVEAEGVRERLAFLAEAGTVLSSSLDYETTLERLAHLAVPALADCCVVDVLGEGREIRQVAVAHVDEAKEQLVRELEERYPTSETDARSPVGRALREARTLLFPDLAGERDAIARDEEHAGGLDALGLVSGMIVPLIARGQTLGAMTFLTAESGRVYDEADVALVDQLAARAAIAVDNARLFGEAEERAQAARALATVADGVLMLDARGVVRVWNPAAEAITGRPASAVVGRPAEEAIPGWSAVHHLLPVAESSRLARGRAQTVPLELAGRELWLSFAGVGFAEGTVFTFRDLTEERRLEQLKSEFVATASHELRTPLAAVYGAAMTLRRDDLELGDERQRILLDLVAEESDRLARIVNDILWASRVDSGELEVQLGPVDAGAVARRVLDAAATHLPDGIALALETNGAQPAVAADEGKLSQVLTNLVDNAIKYSPDGGPVEVRLTPRDGTLLLEVRDEGLGIPAHELGRIFEKFYRLDPNLTRGVGGTGLGLYICRALVERMHGRISVTSEEGRGSTFGVELRLA